MPGEYYYTAEPQSEHRYAELSVVFKGEKLSFTTDSGVFSRTELDTGTEILLNALPDQLNGSLLDMGCGWGVIGIVLARLYPELSVTMVDINQRACELSKKNAEKNRVTVRVLPGDGYSVLKGEVFDSIVQNPPIRAGKAVIYQMFADAAYSLHDDGALYLVIRKQQGAPSAQKYLTTLFHIVDIIEKKAGYWIFCCRKPIKE